MKLNAGLPSIKPSIETSTANDTGDEYSTDWHCEAGRSASERRCRVGQAALGKLQELARGHVQHGTPVGFAKHRMARLEGVCDGMREALFGLAASGWDNSDFQSIERGDLLSV